MRARTRKSGHGPVWVNVVLQKGKPEMKVEAEDWQVIKKQEGNSF